MEAVEVVARFDDQGNITPLQFNWQGSPYQVESVGRRWRDEAGQHILVMAPGGRVFELLYTFSEGRWYLRSIGPNHQTA